MAEPFYQWQPVTDAYREQAIQAADIEAEQVRKRREIKEETAKRVWAAKKAPIGIRIFTWYYFARAGVCALLLLFLASFPQSSPSAWLFDGISNFLHMPGSRSAQEARKQAIEQLARERAIPENAIADESAQVDPEAMHDRVMIYLLLNMAAASVVGFMWWNRSWRVRWVAMFYAGALVAKALINFLAGAASGVGSGIDPARMPMLMMVIGLNALIFLYLAMGIGVKQWFEAGN
jgi:type VI protein secretion system component VasF